MTTKPKAIDLAQYKMHPHNCRVACNPENCNCSPTRQEWGAGKTRAEKLAEALEESGYPEHHEAAKELRRLSALEQKGEPFGYFRAEPMGWTDCAATDEGAIALYERPAAPAVPMSESQRADLICAVAAICTGTSSRTVAATAIEWTERYYGIATPAAPSQPVPFDQWNSSPYTQVLHETIKDLSQKLASMTQSQPVTLTDAWLLERFKHHPNWELSTSNDPECDPSVFWRVHKVEGSRSYREWFLIGEGESPRAAIIAALREKEGK